MALANTLSVNAQVLTDSGEADSTEVAEIEAAQTVVTYDFLHPQEFKIARIAVTEVNNKPIQKALIVLYSSPTKRLSKYFG